MTPGSGASTDDVTEAAAAAAAAIAVGRNEVCGRAARTEEGGGSAAPHLIALGALNGRFASTRSCTRGVATFAAATADPATAVAAAAWEASPPWASEPPPPPPLPPTSAAGASSPSPKEKFIFLVAATSWFRRLEKEAIMLPKSMH
mmetsp:Transcript_62982/g.204133  ORF Transcript_62982/g.204133 Transcript_62982/m.204133 type:complete len:146 (+) Transcript_62982:358-795(+)